MEWINPRYADLVASMRTAEVAIGRSEGPPLRGFLIPEGAGGEGQQDGPVPRPSE